jgi:predicted nucleotidyltransferase
LRDEVIKIANAIRNQRYSDASVVFVAGSLVRGEGTAFSDLDLVVVYESLPNAYRESFRFEGFPVEAFVHDTETLNYFFLEVDRPSGVPSLPQMVKEGIEIPGANAVAQSLKALANSVIEMGPPALTPEDDRKLRYVITDLLDDIRDPRSYAELIATGGRLYEALADYYLRANGRWSAKGKSIPQVLERLDPTVSGKYCESFEALFRHGDPSAVIALSEELLQTRGGLFFEGHRADAPSPRWRRCR